MEATILNGKFKETYPNDSADKYVVSFEFKRLPRSSYDSHL